MDSTEERTIKDWHASQKGSVQVRLVKTESDQSGSFVEYADEFSRIAPDVRIRTEKSDTDSPPSFRIGSNIIYQAIPKEKELEPFLHILSQSVNPAGANPEEFQETTDIKMPAELDLFIAIQCGFCPTAVRNLSGLALKNSLIRLTITDAALFPEPAEAHDIRSVPTLLLDRRFRWSGTLPMDDIVNMMVDRDPEQLSAASIQNMIEDGAATQVADLMISNGTIFPAFIDLLVHDKWPVRLGAMVAMETLGEEHIEIAEQAVAPLMERFEGSDQAIQGDILYLLGIIAPPRIIPTLEMILAEIDDPELAEALEEAVDAIRDRHPS